MPLGEQSRRRSARAREGGTQTTKDARKLWIIARTGPSSRSLTLIAHLHVASRRVLDWGELAAAHLARGNLGRILRLYPIEPVRTPLTHVRLRLWQPYI